MKNEYDFSKGGRGKFHRPGVKLSIPVYLDPKTLIFVDRLAKKRKADLSVVVNDMLRNSILLIETMS